MYTRLLHKIIIKKFFTGKAIILVGARQSGKTTLATEIIENSGLDNSVQKFNCDNPTDRELLNNKDLDFLKKLVGNKKIIFIDEGQKVETIGQTIKLLVDHYKKQRQILVTGSSSINLLNSIQETLTGRKYVYTLYPLSLQEIYSDESYLSLLKTLGNLLIFGNYPEVVSSTSFTDKIELLQELSVSYLFKDILEFQQVKNPILLRNLLRALAFQIGSEVSYTELSSLIGIDKKTVERYIDLLEKNFIIFRLAPFTKNKRREISKLKKIYFYDIGIRNALINNFNFLEARNDIGALWENFIITERKKYRSYNSIYANEYFWRTYDGSEIDLVEEREGKLYGYEFKWNKKRKKISIPKRWQEYPDSLYTEISKQNLENFVI